MGKTFTFLTLPLKWEARRRQQLPGHGHAPGGGNKIMGKLRFLLALWLAKLSVPALKITGTTVRTFPARWR